MNQLMKIEIDWDTPEDIRRDGTRREKYSTVHGWVTKMRGTLIDDERVRRAGIREMKAAKAVREWKRKHAKELRKGGAGGVFSFLSFVSSAPKRNEPRAVVSRGHSRRSSTKRQDSGAVLHFSHRTTSPHRSHSSAKIDGQITHRRATVTRDRPLPERRHTTDVARRPSHQSHHHRSHSRDEHRSRPKDDHRSQSKDNHRSRSKDDYSSRSREDRRPTRTTTRRSTRP